MAAKAASLRAHHLCYTDGMPKQNKNKTNNLNLIIKKCTLLLYAMIVYPVAGAFLFMWARQQTGATRVEDWMVIVATVIGIGIAAAAVWYGFQGRKLDPKSPYDFEHPHNMAIVVGVASIIMWLLFANRLLGS